MDRASQALARGVPPGVSKLYRGLADHSGQKAKDQQHLRDYEEKALLNFLLQLSDLGQPVQIKFIPNLAFCLARHRIESKRPSKPPSKNWSASFHKRYPEAEARRVQALDWNRHEKHIYPKVTH
ncbi:hypothetical protein K505DRAFT_284585, partial [Melanomma pulvis-pyrius CBS 109.77]